MTEPGASVFLTPPGAKALAPITPLLSVTSQPFLASYFKPEITLQGELQRPLVSCKFPTSPYGSIRSCYHSNLHSSICTCYTELAPSSPLLSETPAVALETFLSLLLNEEIHVDLIYFSFPRMIPATRSSNQAFSHLTSHRS